MLFECVPNISLGSDLKKIEKIAKSVEKSGAKLLHIHPTPDIERSVITFIGDKQQILEGAFELIKTASALIDMRTHKGAHPRIGAVDVCPFVPLKDADMEDCIKIARELGQLVAKELEIPVFMYEESAFFANRKALPDVRRSEFEGLGVRKDLPDYYHDKFFSTGYHPTAGAVIIGARKILVAYNITLSSNATLNTAKTIAKEIRERQFKDSSLSMPYVRAIGWAHPITKEIQVSINLTDYTVTSMWRVFKRVSELAVEYGTDVDSSEIIGLIPKRALERIAADAIEEKTWSTDAYKAVEILKLRDFDYKEKVLEERSTIYQPIF